MSNQDVILALDLMERMLHEGDLTASALARWQERFDAAMASAEREPGWAVIAERSHVLGQRLGLTLAGVLADRDAVQRKLRLMAKGGRALKAYKPDQS
jgi:hypothetical protein